MALTKRERKRLERAYPDLFQGEELGDGVSLPEGFAWSIQEQAPPPLTAPVAGVWRLIAAEGAPDPRSQALTLWTGKEMLVWGGQANALDPLGDGARFLVEANVWIPLPRSTAVGRRYAATCVWTASEFLVWGGHRSRRALLNTGAAYDPATGRWRRMATHGAPSARGYATGIWTGNRLLVWSGQGLGLWLADGGLYDPISDTWEAIPADDVPQAIRAAVPLHPHWSGSELMMWAPRPLGPEHVVLGYAYDPAAGSWRSLAPATGIAAGPDGRFGGARIWTGAELLIWYGPEAGGAVYDYAADRWRPMATRGAPRERNGWSAIQWTGRQMILWGGTLHRPEGERRYMSVKLNDGGVFDLASNSWRALPVDGAPRPRSLQSAVWTGAEMLIWGGTGEIGAASVAYLGDGAALRLDDESQTIL